MRELWNPDLLVTQELGGMYVAISGNTAAGKSSLINEIRERDCDLVTIQERSLHHPLLRLMFSAPDQFAFPIQLNFVLQRHLALYHHLCLDHCIVIERSHLDDELFIQEHAAQGRLSPGELDAWYAMWNALNARLRWPDVLVLMNPAPEISLERLTHAETSGQRPQEFPDEASKKAWIYRWHEAYVLFHERIRQSVVSDTTLVEIDPASSTEESAKRVWEAMANHPRYFKREKTLS